MVTQDEIEAPEASDAAEQADSRVLLVCTVGGSPQPIATALRVLRPEVVWFLVSDGKIGESSWCQVEDDEIDYNNERDIRGPGLKRAEGCPPTTRVLPIPADDSDQAYALCRSYLAEVRRNYPDHHLIADYTGGTKSMTGALLMAAFAEPGVEVQFMVGERSDLVRVKSGSEKPQRMSADFIVAERDFAAAEQAVDAYDYAAALRVLDDLHHRLRRSTAKPSLSFCDHVEGARAWARIMADWDAFRHGRAAEAVRREQKRARTKVNALDLHAHAAEMARRAQSRSIWLSSALELSHHLVPLLALGEREHGVPGWDVCADLWLNALRRGERGRYDDAVARLYRLVEAAAQAWLWTRYELKSGRIPWGRTPESMRDGVQRRSDSGGDYALLALNQTVEFLRCCDRDDRFAAAYASDWAGAAGLQGPPWLTQRNSSILAHGFTSVGEKVWTQAKTWVEVNVRPFFVEADFPQLPRKIPRL
jgi:CRISPR-associated protein (TIGR02710 family)